MSSTSGHAARTEALAEFIGRFTAADLPKKVLDDTLLFVRDGAGALLSATNPKFSTGRLVAAFARERGGKAESTVIGSGFKTDCVNAALANGTMGYASDVEPHHPEGILHPVAVMTPTALAVGEREGKSGLDFLAAVALGLEVEYRTSMALGPAEQYALGFHPSAVCGCFGATAAAGFLLGLGKEAMVRAFGLAACQASGLMAWESDPTENARPFQMGVAARNGVTSALLAEAGFGGPIGVFDHGHTIFKAFSRNPKPDLLTKGLGREWDGVVELAVKPYSCVSFLHPGLDALLSIVNENDLKPGDIESLVMHFPKSGVHCVDDNPLKSHCAQYILPVAVASRAVQVADIFFDRRETEPEVKALSERVRVVADTGELEKLFPDFYATVIEVKTKGGKTFKKRNDIARGYPETPMTEAELVAKFKTLAGSVADGKRIDALLACFKGLAKAKDVRGFAELMATPAKTA
jgi:2-methylcitrate dehydratase PrpD